jgi:hypothetical protein
MALYELIVRCGSQKTETIREIRKYGSLGVAEIVSRMRAGEPVIAIETNDFPIDLDIETGIRRQHAAVLGAHDVLSTLGNEVAILYRPSKDDWPPESVDVDGVKNLMESDLIYRSQEHD